MAFVGAKRRQTVYPFDVARLSRLSSTVPARRSETELCGWRGGYNYITIGGPFHMQERFRRYSRNVIRLIGRNEYVLR